MAAPDLSTYRLMPNGSGYYQKISDRAGPYVWDGTTMTLVGMEDDNNDTVLNPSATFTRPNDVIAYAIDDLVANHTTAGSVAPMSWAITADTAGAASIFKARLRKSTATVANAFFALHLYRASPVAANGDNGAYSTDKSDDYIGRMDFGAMMAFTDGACANAVPAIGYDLGVKLAAGTTIYGLLQAKGAYVPGNAEVFRVILETEEA